MGPGGGVDYDKEEGETVPFYPCFCADLKWTTWRLDARGGESSKTTVNAHLFTAAHSDGRGGVLRRAEAAERVVQDHAESVATRGGGQVAARAGGGREQAVLMIVMIIIISVIHIIIVIIIIVSSSSSSSSSSSRVSSSNSSN